MKVLLDTCVWGGVVAELRSAGHDVEWIGELPDDPRDDEILAQAHKEERVLVTLDKDFGELAILRRTPHHGIVRLVDFSARKPGAICLDVLSRYGGELLAGAIVTADRGRVRIRAADPLPDEIPETGNSESIADAPDEGDVDLKSE